MFKKYGDYILNLLVPAFVFGSVTGVLTSLAVNLYKWGVHHVVHGSERIYSRLSEKPWLIAVAVLAVSAIALLFSLIYRKMPDLRGGGIPTSIGILRGLIVFRWLIHLIGTVTLSLISFFIGVPLGNEGPSVHMGTAIGKGSVHILAKKHRAWDRYSMTGGACAGFSVSLGAPVSGILFSIEEAHQRISPMIMIVSATSVMFAKITTDIIAPVLGVSPTLFPKMEFLTLAVKDIWIPLVIGIALGALAVAFLSYYRTVNNFFNSKFKKIPHCVKLIAVFVCTVILGSVSFNFVSTGHELIISLFDNSLPVWLMLIILAVRATLTLSATSNGVTGGIFLPTLAVGALLSGVIGRILTGFCGLQGEYYAIVMVLGITACISGMMKMPLTAIVFTVEAFGGYANILYIVFTAVVSFAITEVFGVKSINDSVLEHRIEELTTRTKPKVLDAFVTVKAHSFAIGKQIRDIFWPANLFVLSLKKNNLHGAQVDEHGGKEIKEGDVLHVRYSTVNETQTRQELLAIVGEQDYEENAVESV